MICGEALHVLPRFSPFQPPSADSIGSNEDFIIQILVRVPVRSLLRFKCVSKQWCAVISRPDFCRLFNQSVASPTALFALPSYHRDQEYLFLPLDEKPSPAPFRSLKFVDDPEGIRILHSCNGLLICCSNYTVEAHNRSYYIYNPTINQYRILPKTSSMFHGAVFGIFLAFNPSKSVHYKVVLVRSSDTLTQPYQIEIYSSETRLWRISSDPFSTDVNLRNGVFCHNAIHWMSSWGRFLCFDLDQERFKEMPGIGDWGGGNQCRYFGGSRDNLHLILSNDSYQSKELDVYEMEKDYSRWFIKYRVDLSQVISVFPEMIRSSINHPPDMDSYAFQVLAMIRGENEEESSLVLHLPGKVICYSFKNQDFRILQNLAPGCTDIQGCLTLRTAFAFIESFSSV